MTAENCREWRESLGAYALGQLSADERAGLEAHLEGCPECRAELDSLTSVAKLLPLADPKRLGTVPSLPRGLGDRVMATIAGERRSRRRRRRLRGGLALSGATAVVAAAVLAIFVLGGEGEEAPSTHVSFRSLPGKLEIGARLEPRPFGTEVHVYVKGVRSGELCRVFLRAEDGSRMPAGSFRYRWGDDSQAILSSALDLEQTDALGIRVGERTFIETLGDERA
jgi:Putative zinc-finger